MPAVDGIVSGFDTTALIEGLATAYSIPLQFMEGDLEDEKATLEKISGLSNRLEDLSEAIGNLQGEEGLVAFTATSGNETAFTAAAASGAAPGSYTIDVQRMATNEVEVSSGYASASDEVGEGTFSVTYGGTTTDVTIDGANNSLQGLADALNDVEGVSAYVLDTGDGATPFKLVVQGDDTGADNTITLDATGLTGGIGTPPTFTEQVSAEDAHVTVNNVDVYSGSNSFENIPGVTLDLKAAGHGPTQLDVGLDQETMLANVQAFVDAYNEIQSFYDTNTAFNAEEGIQGALVGDSTARRVMETLGQQVSNTADAGDGNPFQALSQIGIKTERDGTLSIDEDRLEEVLANDLQDVQDMFTAETGALGALKSTIDDVFVDPENGTLESRKDSINDSIEDLELRIERQEVRLDDYTNYLREKFTAMEVAMAQFEGTATYLTSMFAPQSDS